MQMQATHNYWLLRGGGLVRHVARLAFDWPSVQFGAAQGGFELAHSIRTDSDCGRLTRPQLLSGVE